MIFRQLFDTQSSTYTYLLADAKSKQALLIDPVVDKIDTYLQLLRELQLKLVVAIDTHLHADHITALGGLREVTGCKTLMGRQSAAPCVSETFADGDVVALGELALNVIYTPGHTDDSYCFLLSHGGESYLFSGDTLLIRGTGRTDFQNGDAQQQYASLFDTLLKLPDDTRVYPGHDYKGWTMSTIGEEKANNPRLQVGTMAEYVALMDSLNLPNPALMDIAVSTNQACGQL